MSVIIRDAVGADREDILSVVMDGWSEYAGMLSVAGWEEMRSSLAAMAPVVAEEARVFVAELDGKLVGAVGYYGPGRSDGVIFPREWASVRLLSVARAARGLGLGRALMERCVAAAREDGAATLGLHTGERVVVALGLYGRMGFVVDGDLPYKYSMRRWRFRLDLAADPVDAPANHTPVPAA